MPGWRPAPSPIRRAVAELAAMAGLPAAGDLPAGPGVCPASGVDAGGPRRRDPGHAADARPPSMPASPPHSRCPASTWSRPAASSSTAWACTLAPAWTRTRSPPLAGSPGGSAARLLDELHGEGLLTETGHRRYGMHDLIRRYAADRAAATMTAGAREAAMSTAAGLLPADDRAGECTASPMGRPCAPAGMR